MNLFYTRPDPYLHLGVFPFPRVEHVKIGGAPAFMQPLRALFLSDVHLRPSVSEKKLHALMELISAQGADMILMGGDYAESPDQCLRFWEAMRRVRVPLGCFAVAGNNDFDSMPGLRKTMAESGAILLDNECARIALPGGRLCIGGCADHKYGSPRTRGLFDSEKAAYRILLSHFPVMPDCRCDLMLSGHTHGGQMNLLGLTPYSIGFERSFHLLGVRGLRRVGEMRLLIGSGIGVSRLPLRLGARPQICLLEFASEDSP